MALTSIRCFALLPGPGHERGDLPPVHVAINDDDPITFATNLGDKFAHIHFALLYLGISSRDALQWRDDALISGMRALHAACQR